MHERIWQFKLTEETTETCARYFAKRASELAEALSCRLVTTGGIKVEERPGRVDIVMGTALLENRRENVVGPRMAGLSQRNSRNFLSGGGRC